MNTIAFQNGIKRAQEGMQQFQRGAARVAKAAGEMTREMRERDIQAYGAAMDGLRAKFNPLYGVIRTYRDTVAEVRQAHAVGAISAEEMTAAINRERTAALASIGALKGRTTALTQMGGASRLAAANARNLSYQLIDIGQGIPLMFQSPLYGLQNLGFQIAQISQLYMGQGGLSQALKDVGGQLLGFTRYLGPAALAVGAVAAGVAGLTHEINQSAEVQVGFFDVVQAGFSLISEQIMGVVGPAINQLLIWFGQMWGVISPVLKTVGNGIIGTFVGAFDAVVASWDKLPAAMGDLIIQAANTVIQHVKYMIRSVQVEFNKFFGGLDQMLQDAGMPTLGIRVDPISLAGGEIPNPFAGAASGAGKAASGAFSNAMSRDYLGEAFGALSQRAQDIARTRAEMEALEDATGKAGGKAKELGDKLSEAAKAAQQEWEFYRSTFSGFFSDLRGGLSEGKNFWQSFGEAASSALNKILDRWMELIANNIFSILMPSPVGGGGGGGGLLSGLFSGIGKLFGFAQGGSFQVGGSGGIDSQLVAFKASPNETVSVTKPGQEARMAQPVRVELEVQEGALFDTRVRRIAGEGDVQVAKTIERNFGGMMADYNQRNG
ncbi:hypothetical protein [Pelagibacterium mangrovi]|uniref:hypothetical protein n=1 Tax=Pelagibacterium mangrovi TaxID=3119828 RepID=UPI002FCA1B51